MARRYPREFRRAVCVRLPQITVGLMSHRSIGRLIAPLSALNRVKANRASPSICAEGSSSSPCISTTRRARR